jgi:hypothetical protein
MAWNPDDTIPDTPFTKPERRDVRRVVRWYERREYLRSGARSWALWIVGLPTAMIAFWQIAQLLIGHFK